MKINQIKLERYSASIKHPYHIQDPSPWPQLMSTSGQITAFGLVTWMSSSDTTVQQIGSMMTSVIFISWWRDVLREAVGGKHTEVVRKGLTIGQLLFLVSEIMLFFSFFWAFFHSSQAPNIEQGVEWPPQDIHTIDPWSIPLQGTFILLSSGFTVTQAHHAIRGAKKDLTCLSQFITVLQGCIFVFLQFTEYSVSEYTMSDSVYGSAFYMTTGLHGIHVIVGTLFLFICFVRLVLDQYTYDHHQGFEFAIFYWHLVDLVWFFVFFSYYWWGSL